MTWNGVRLVAAGAGRPGGEAGEPLVSVVLGENHTRLHRSLRFVLETDDGVVVLAEATALAIALRHVGRFRPDVLLFDPWLVDDRASRRSDACLIRRRANEIVVLTMDKSRTLGKQALDADAMGFMLKDAADSELPEAVRMVARARRYTSARVSVQRVAGMQAARPATSGSAGRGRGSPLIASRTRGAELELAHQGRTRTLGGTLLCRWSGLARSRPIGVGLSEREEAAEQTGLMSGPAVRCGSRALLGHRSRRSRCASAAGTAALRWLRQSVNASAGQFSPSGHLPGAHG